MNEPRDLPVHSAREELLVGFSDGEGECRPAAGNDGGLVLVEELAQPFSPSPAAGVEVDRQPEALLGRAGDEGREPLAGADVHCGSGGHGASGEVQAQEKCVTPPAEHVRGLTAEEFRAAVLDVLEDVQLEAELARESTLGDFSLLVDYRAKWKRDAINAVAARIRNRFESGAS